MMKCKPIKSFFITCGNKTTASCAINFSPTQTWDLYDIGNNLVELYKCDVAVKVHRETFEKLFRLEDEKQ